MKGVFLVIEGGDGSGKSSQITLLNDYCKKTDKKVKSIHFPRVTAKPYGQMIAEYLRGEYGAVDVVNPKLAALLYALDRQQAAAQLKDIIASGHTLIADRYIFSNIAYQCAKIADEKAKAELADWIETLEYGHHGIPRPDLTLYLDVPPEFSRSNLTSGRKGSDRDYLLGQKDIHEADLNLQDKVREEFLRLAKARTGEIGVVDCRGVDGGIADRKTIHSRIVDALRYYGVVAR
ncbi:MAG: dTMP kinase [Planctomycetaceae bacterium]|nr:dTMP kinase [Planctomycetaceae bacterium]